ncbi:MAG TPA: polysaccharide biosynthesis/export family protein [Blastocatellia bacterium]|nr:polysaccharide biosynthesis/export family protein [Blastocatellia bacterium]
MKHEPLLSRKHRRHLRVFLFGTVLGLLLIAAHSPAARAQQERPQPQQQADASSQPLAKSTAAVLASSDEDYRIGPRDVIEVAVNDAPELSGTFEVSADGSFPMPYLGRIIAKRRTPDDLGRYIADGLRTRYLKDPRVVVVVKQYNSRTFFIHGSVRSPGAYQIVGRPSLLQLVTVAGGLADNHGSLAIILRPRKADTQAAGISSPVSQPASEVQHPSLAPAADEGEQYDIIQVNINGLLRGRLDENLRIEPGDIINIPQADVFFVGGEVHAPGSYRLKEGTTLRQAISLAQGTNFKAATRRGRIFREDPTGKNIEIPVDIGAVMSGKRDDIPILANDIILVPNSRFKSVGGALLSAFGLGSAARVPVR